MEINILGRLVCPDRRVSELHGTDSSGRGRSTRLPVAKTHLSEFKHHGAPLGDHRSDIVLPSLGRFIQSGVRFFSDLRVFACSSPENVALNGKERDIARPETVCFFSSSRSCGASRCAIIVHAVTDLYLGDPPTSGGVFGSRLWIAEDTRGSTSLIT